MINEQKSSKKSYFFSNVALWYFKVQKNFAVNHLPLERGLAVQTWTSNRKPDGKGLVTWLLDIRGSRKMPKNLNPEAGESYFQYILLNEIQTMFSQLAKRSARVLHRICVLIMRITSKTTDQRFWEETKAWRPKEVILFRGMEDWRTDGMEWWNGIAEYTEYSKMRNIWNILKHGVYRIF